jgi:uncharacterized phage-like protein YoqJ
LENRICFFTGHRKLTPVFEKEITPVLKKSVVESIRLGYRTFLCGGALGFDMLAEETVLSLRDNEYPEIQLVLALPHRGQEQNWPIEKQRKYREILVRSDSHNYLFSRYIVGCMQKRNRYMADRSSRCICCLFTQRGGTYSTVQYALGRHIEVLNLYDQLKA